MIGHAFRVDECLTTFMRMMNDILQPFTNSFVVVYLDDILIFSQTWEVVGKILRGGVNQYLELTEKTFYFFFL